MSAEKKAGVKAVFEEYKVPLSLQANTRAAFEGIQRWGEGVMTPSDTPESVWEHMESGIALLEEQEAGFTEGASYFDWPRAKRITVCHEIGEIVKHDLVISRPDYEQVVAKWKRGERLAVAVLLGRGYVEDPDLKVGAWDSYTQYVHYKPDDSTALLCHLNDKVVAVRFGLDHVYNKKNSADQLVQKHAALSLGVLLKFVSPLLKIAPEGVRKELMMFMRGEVEGYRTAGYSQIADEGQARLMDIWEEVANPSGR